MCEDKVTGVLMGARIHTQIPVCPKVIGHMSPERNLLITEIGIYLFQNLS